MANKVGLTDAKIAGLKAPTAGQIELADGIVPGLRLRMGASGIKTYILRKRVQGKWLNVTIGRHGQSFTLAHARKKARDLLVDVEQGKSIARKAGAKRKGSKGVGTVAELWDVEHGACAMLLHTRNGQAGRLAMIDSGCTDDWRPSTFIRQELNRAKLDYLFITNADQDHMSDLKGLDEEGVIVPVLIRNPTYTGEEMASIKAMSGRLSRDAIWYVGACSSHNQPVSEPFNDHMGGITATCFFNSYPQFTNTNDLSLVVFIKYAGFKILFPGDLEVAGWKALLADPVFRAELAMTDILVASHHGRQSGYCAEVFDFCSPSAVVISDKPIIHDTQRTVPDYRRVVRDGGVVVRTTGKRRHVLTTRRDGSIIFTVNGDGGYYIDTEYAG